MSFKLPGMDKILKQVQQVQENMKQAEEIMAKLEVTGQAGAGLVKVKFNGLHECLSVDFDPELKNEDLDMIGDLVKSAIIDAMRKIKTANEESKANITGGLNIPGLDSFLK